MPARETERAREPAIHGDRGWVQVLRVLSADCAFALLPYMGLPADETARKAVSALAKRYYEALLNGAKTVYGIDFTPSRVATEVTAFLRDVDRDVGQVEGRQVAAFGEAFCKNEARGGSMPEALWSALLFKLRAQYPDVKPPPPLGPDSIEKIFTTYDQSDAIVETLRREMRECLSEERISRWDRALIEQTPELPSQLGDLIESLLDLTAFKRFWHLLQQALPEPEIQVLTAWLQVESARLAPHGKS